MKKIIWLIVIVLILSFAGISFARQEIDNCSNYLKAGDYKRAIEAGERAVRLYPKDNGAHFCLGIAYFRVGELGYALKSMKEAERLTTNKTDLMYVYSLLGSIYYRKGDIDNALFYYSKHLFLSRELGYKEGEAAAIHNIAAIYDTKGDIDKALDYYEQSLKLESDEKGKASTYNNIAAIYDKKGNYQKAIEYLKKAIEIDERTGNYHGVAQCMLNIGNIYRKAKDFYNASEYLNEGLMRIQKIGDKYWEAYAYKYLGWLYRDKDNLRLAADYLTKAVNLFNSIGAKGEAQGVLYDLNEVKAILSESNKADSR